MAGSKDEKGQSDSITSPFDTIRHMDGEREYWSARDMAKLLGYSEYSKFKNVIRKAEIACKNCGRAVSDHFVYVRNESQIGKDARRKREDVHLSRYACYMLVQSADPRKPMVALSQNYIVAQTRRRELNDEMAANSFRASLIRQKIEREQIRDKEEIDRIHDEMDRAVRETIIKTGAALPEDLPTSEKSIQQIEREEQQRLKQQQQPLLFRESPMQDESGK